jgi:uncharacterized protein with HEPN domain
MSAKVKVPDTVKTRGEASQHQSHSVSDTDSDVPRSSIQRMRGKIILKNPEQIHRIIFDPSLEPA